MGDAEDDPSPQTAARNVEVGIVAQRDNDRAQSLAATLVETLEGPAVTVFVDEETGGAIGRPSVPVGEMSACALVVSIGGDGTFLFVAREAGAAPILGVNLGEVGFLNAVAPEDAVETVVSLVADLRDGGSLDTHEADRLEAVCEDVRLSPALNEVVVHGPRRGPAGGADLEIRVDGERYAASRADGVLVSTPTGSTAYNLSEGGPLVRPGLEAIVVTQMCATETMPPLVVDRDSEVTLRLSGAEVGYAISDGRDRRALEPPATVTVRVADDPISIAGPEANFFRALEKLE